MSSALGKTGVLSNRFLSSDWHGRQFYLLGVAMLLIGSVPALSQAFAPTSEFIHRGDDAFYYFGIAANYPEYGFWTFDGLNATNGVQPLWAVILTAFSQLLHWLGITDVGVLARIFVGLTGVLHVAGCALLFHLLARTVSVGTGMAAAGGLLFSMGIVWSRVWGMENSLYVVFLLATITYYHLRFAPHPTSRKALALGILLGLTALTRLNAGLLIPVLLLALLLRREPGLFRTRLGLAVVIGAAASALILPYLIWNYASTGHLLPVSGAIKAIQSQEFMEARSVERGLNRDYLSMMFWTWRGAIQWFVTSRAFDGLWVVGIRLLETGQGTYATLAGIVGGLVLVPPVVCRDTSWWIFLCARLQRLATFWYVLLFGTVNAFLSIYLYPTERYSTIRWWLAENETILVVVAATVAVAGLAFVANRFLMPDARIRLAAAGLGALAIAHVALSVHSYWDGVKQDHDWNQSWNDESYLAAQWINANLPPGALVGSWNAGVLGYYAERPVVNLDGLINGFDFLEYRRNRRTAEYIRRQGIEYLSDLQPMFDRPFKIDVRRDGREVRILEELEAVPVYTHYTASGEPYRIYRVGPNTLDSLLRERNTTTAP